MKTDPNARYQGYSFYFREGFCWNNVLNPLARLLKVKIKQASVNDVGSMALMPLMPSIQSKYITAILNSNLIFDYYRVFVNCTVNIQINDLRQIPIIVPNNTNIKEVNNLVDKAINSKKSALLDSLDISADDQLNVIENAIDDLISKLYQI